jgi:hypothetical protein
MHIVIDRLGASGRMMQIHPAKTINPKALRALQVDTAIEYGIALNDTPRVSRGHRDRGLSSPEWRAEQRGERRDQSPTRNVYAKTASSFADDAIGREANELKKLSDRYRNAETPERRKEAKAFERAAFILSSGGTLDDAPQMRAKEQSEPKREGGKREKMSEKAEKLDQESPTVTPDAAVDRRSRAPFDQIDRAPNEFERSRTPNRRLTELELRELLNAKERELSERQRHEREKHQLSSKNADSPEPDILPRDIDHTNEQDGDYSLERGSSEKRQRGSEHKKPLTEQELSDLLSEGVKKLNDAEKRQRDEGHERKPNHDLDFGFD